MPSKRFVLIVPYKSRVDLTIAASAEAVSATSGKKSDGQQRLPPPSQSILLSTCGDQTQVTTPLLSWMCWA